MKKTIEVDLIFNVILVGNSITYYNLNTFKFSKLNEMRFKELKGDRRPIFNAYLTI